MSIIQRILDEKEPNYDQLRMLGEETSKFAAQTWGIESHQFGLGLLQLSRIYKGLGDSEKQVLTLERCAIILKQCVDENLPFVCLHLRRAYGKENPEKAYFWADEAFKHFQDKLEKDPSPSTLKMYACALVNLIFSADICGYFKLTTVRNLPPLPPL
eukprot:TRINITY_DN4414_c0_g4_i5.p2 TRINITY_DN4414_c0_g4~~TRINITY_DN4414_c0_g4_i5.p2  ORF type:complete len:157 (-),score=31.09 TRINITY_DN4414_c0_g4_i5:1160-1630(-)